MRKSADQMSAYDRALETRERRNAADALPAPVGGSALPRLALPGAALHYYLRMLSLALVVLVLGSISIWTAGHLHHFLDLILGVGTILIALNLLGAWRIFRPIAGFLSVPADFERARRRIERLPLISGGWAFMLVLLHMYLQFFFHHARYVLNEPNLLDLLFFPLVLIAVFGAYMGLFVYFLIGDYTARLREAMFAAHNIVIAPGTGRVLYKLAVAFIAAAILPLAFISLRMHVFEDSAQLPGLAARQVIENDILGAALLTGVAIIFTARNLTRPVTTLLTAMERLSKGDLRTRAPVISDDEIGRVSLAFNAMADELQEQAFIREIFGKFVPDGVAAAVMKDRGIIGPQLREATILFTDIEGFTAICERLEPEEVITMLNDYFAAVAEPIHEFGGVITQFQGDAMLVSFNLPVEDPDHAANALRAALGIQDVVRTRRFVHDIPLNTRIGINTGVVVGGIVGDGRRLGYTVHGDTVNLAARLEQMNKEHGSRILISQRTAELAGGGFAMKEVGRMQIRGHRERVVVYEIPAS